MKKDERLAVLVAAMLAIASFATAGENVQLIEPTLEIFQIGGLPGYASVGGPVTVEYEIRVHNPSSEPITLTRVSLQSVSPVTSYALRSDSRPFDIIIEPDSVGIVTYRALVDAQGGMIGSQTPVNLKGVAFFDSEVGGFAKAFTHQISSKGQRTRG